MMTYRNIGAFASVLWVASLGASCGSAEIDELKSSNRKVTSADCGMIAVYLLLELQSHPSSFEMIERCLPPIRPSGYSMQELSDALDHMGVPVAGIVLNSNDRVLTMPSIAYFRNRSEGHFVVLRPIGSDGRMIQILDPPSAPRVVDFADLFKIPGWTGKALICVSPWLGIGRHVAVLVLSIVGVYISGAHKWVKKIIPEFRHTTS